MRMSDSGKTPTGAVPITEWPITDDNVTVIPKQVPYNSTQNNICSDEAQKGNKRSHDEAENLCDADPPSKVMKYLDIVTADIALAKWWRRHGRRLISPAVLPKSNNPNTVLNYVQRVDIAKDFLKNELKRLTALSLDTSQTLSKEDSIQLHSALASYHEKLGNFSIAKVEVLKALENDPHGGSVVSEYEHGGTEAFYFCVFLAKEVLWLSAKLDKQMQIKSTQQKHIETLQTQPDENRCFPKCKAVERRCFKSLNFEEFFTKYSKTSTPVVITGYLPLMTDSPWTFSYVKNKAGKCKVSLKKYVPESVEWARLENDKISSVAEFVDSVIDGEETGNLCLFDWSLPLHCPQLAEEITVPRYFAGDFLQRVTHGSLYHESWPSLFIAPKGITTELHVDAFGSNFWMAVFEGRKRWVFFPRKDQPLLYPQYTSSMDPVFEVNLDSPDLNHHPLLSLTQPMECVLEPGDLLFVPSGCPHRVENLETSLAISGNFVDLSNFKAVKEELEISALIDPRAEDLLTQFTSDTFNSKMSSSISDLPWKKYKMWPPDSFNDYDITS
ncbi:LOW QUALITY PROTEIN: bifunctional arginine demethylase and lysyl-hydroxylase JMJD6-like [Liolophura sinensis]|uniref:LOW QUALITY PROTEIN: bifunctional arginine demethylase and lysyl-hydroxylase JMJD6-like n=1 Tax=Liolophura sinensis TaxID=3198878 RepID=UPI0031594169